MLFTFFVFAIFFHETHGSPVSLPKLKNLKKYELVTPLEIAHNDLYLNEKMDDGTHPSKRAYVFKAFGKDFKLNLKKNDDLFGEDYKEIEMDAFGNIVNVKHASDIENCYYQGIVTGDESSIVALSACDGIHGVIFGNGEHLHIEPSYLHDDLDKIVGGNDLMHVVYRNRDILSDQPQFTCGIKDPHTYTPKYNYSNSEKRGKERGEAEAEEEAEGGGDGSILSNARRLLATCPGGSTKYMDGFIFNDYTRYLRLGADTTKDTLNIFNIAESYYRVSPFKYCVSLALRGQITFTLGNPPATGEFRFRPCNTLDPNRPKCTQVGCFNNDACDLDNNLSDVYDVGLLLSDFAKWGLITRRAQIQAIFNGANLDNIHLFTGFRFDRGIGGLAYVGTMCGTYSAGVDSMLSNVIGWNAQVYAHELGHNWGANHDSVNNGNIMGAKDYIPTTFSQESINSINKYFSNYDAGVYDKCLESANVSPPGPVCGNGFVEPGEQCDPGLTADSCCVNCKYASGCKCANYQICCSNGQFKPAGTVCRRAVDSVCDQAETCNGLSGICPPDLVSPVGTICTDSGGWKSNCYEGKCVASRVQQCRRSASTPDAGGCDSATQCNFLDCGSSINQQCSYYWNIVPDDGTPCGGSSPLSKFCVNGVCKPKEEILPLHSIYCTIGSISVRLTSSTSAAVQFTANPNDGFEVIGKLGDWFQIRSLNGGNCGRSGWVPFSSLKSCTVIATC